MMETVKKTRIYVDGCFDLVHFGHANVLRQASRLGNELIVGVCSDKDIEKHKGVAPVLQDDERIKVIESMKWVTSIIKGAPYMLNEEFIKELMHDHDIDYIVHGDDPCLDVNRKNAYEGVKRMGKFKIIKRTEGISSTNIIDRILQKQNCQLQNSSFLLISKRVSQFSNSETGEKDYDKVVYVPGNFDLFHIAPRSKRMI